MSTTKLKAVARAVLRTPKAKKVLVALLVSLATLIGATLDPEGVEAIADFAVIVAQAAVSE